MLKNCKIGILGIPNIEVNIYCAYMQGVLCDSRPLKFKIQNNHSKAKEGDGDPRRIYLV